MLIAYQKLFEQQNFHYDHAQVSALSSLAELSLTISQQENRHWLKKLTNLSPKKSSGIYFYGRVGRGKTMLMDLFYQHLPITKKKRIHFHRFMEEVHRQLNSFTGREEPLKRVARLWAKDIKVLCFDEFFISDIGDAMLIAGLLEELFDCGVTLVATSNCNPEQLYRNGLQRERFLPTIDLLNKHCQVLSVDGEKDHRLSHYHEDQQYRDYFYPHQHRPDALQETYAELSEANILSGEIMINNRKIPFIAKFNDVILFDFYALCSGPRSQRDYIVLADDFNIVMIDRVPQFCGDKIFSVTSGVEDSYQRGEHMLADLRLLDDEARRFIALVDEFYDRKIRLIINAEVDINQLYQGQQLSFEFARCQSRLIEMQSASYRSIAC